MKPSKAPENVYVHKSQYWGLMANEHNITKDGIEYIRKDAFISKASEWLRNFNDFHNIMRYSDCCEVPLDQLIEDFKNYITEEKV